MTESFILIHCAHLLPLINFEWHSHVGRRRGYFWEDNIEYWFVGVKSQLSRWCGPRRWCSSAKSKLILIPIPIPFGLSLPFLFQEGALILVVHII